MGKSKTNKEIIIRTEGGSEIGMGHIMRSLPIAHVLRERGMSVSFILNNDSAAIDAVTSAGFPVNICSPEQPGGVPDIKSCSAVIFDTKSDVLEEVRYFNDKGLKTVLIDNLTPASELADIVIVPSLSGIRAKRIEKSTIRLIEGPEHFPLNPAFKEVRDSSEKNPGPKLRVLVTMGGADPNNLTQKVLNALEGMNGMKITVVIGPSMAGVSDLIESYEDVEFVMRPDVNKMALLMNESYIAITAFGITLFELAYMGAPSVVIANYREDKKDMDAIKKLGTGMPLGYHEDVTDADIRHAVGVLVKDSGMRESMSQNGKILIDGHGVERIADIIIKQIMIK